MSSLNSGNDEFVLSRTLLSDGEPVRSLCYLTSSDSMDVDGASPSSLTGTVVTGSQGAMLTKFPLSSDTTAASPGMMTISGGHSHQITALTTIPRDATPDRPDLEGGGYVSGCKDNFIRVFTSDSTQECALLLSGHENAVTSLSWVTLGSHTLLVSGSWDGTARLWNLNTGECVCVLPGHENTVCVCGLPGDKLATGSAGVAEGNTIKNHKIRIWDLSVVEEVDGVVKRVDGKCVKEVMDHGGPVRGLCLDPDTLFLASCSNDGTVKIRDSTTGECLVTHTHPGDSTPLVLAVAAIGNGRFVSVTEDGAAVVWNPDGGGGGGGSSSQVVLHPDCVWCVLPLPNGDFATGCNDGVTRVFTTDSTRCAPAQETAAFHDAVSEAMAKRSSGGPSAEEIAKLPKWEDPHPVGRSEGQVQVFSKNGTKAIAAQWSVASGTWIEVGEVTGKNEDAGTINGVRYDHVFPIEIDVRGGGVRTLHIGYNTGDNPFVTAQAFIDEHELDQNYLGQIADYVRQRAGQAAPTIGTGGGGGGASSFRSGSNTVFGAEVPPPAAPTFVHLPMKSFMTFDTGTDKSAMGKICSKIREFNTSLGSDDDGGAALVLSADEEARLDTLASTLSATSRYHSSKIDNGELNVVGKMLAEWPVDKVFPGLDLARLVVLHPDASSSKRSGFWSDVFRLTLEKCAAVRETNIEGIGAVAVPMLSFRLFANSFKGSGSGVAVASTLKSVLDCAETNASSKNKNIRLSVATVALNASSLMLSSPTKHNSSPEQLLKLLHSIFASGLYEGEAMTRALVALGTTLLISDDVKATARSLDIYAAVTQNIASCGPKGKAVSEEVRTILDRS